MEKKQDGNYTRMLCAVLNKSWKQHPSKQYLYSHLPPISKTIQIRWTRHVGHCCRIKDKLIRNVLLWTPTNRLASVGWPARTYIGSFLMTDQQELILALSWWLSSKNLYWLFLDDWPARTYIGSFLMTVQQELILALSGWLSSKNLYWLFPDWLSSKNLYWLFLDDCPARTYIGSFLMTDQQELILALSWWLSSKNLYWLFLDDCPARTYIGSFQIDCPARTYIGSFWMTVQQELTSALCRHWM